MQRNNVSLTSLELLNTLLYVLEHGCKWHSCRNSSANGYTIYTRMNRWSKTGARPVFSNGSSWTGFSAFASSCSHAIRPRSRCARMRRRAETDHVFGQSQSGREPSGLLLLPPMLTRLKLPVFPAMRATRSRAGSSCAARCDAGSCHC